MCAGAEGGGSGQPPPFLSTNTLCLATWDLQGLNAPFNTASKKMGSKQSFQNTFSPRQIFHSFWRRSTSLSHCLFFCPVAKSPWLLNGDARIRGP